MQGELFQEVECNLSMPLAFSFKYEAQSACITMQSFETVPTLNISKTISFEVVYFAIIEIT
jgi:hypothetical protein